MQENNFEKDVQQSLDGLKVRPATAVWDNLERELRQRKKRRFFFLFGSIAAGLLLLGTASYFYFSRNGQNNIASAQQVQGNNNVANNTAGGSGNTYTINKGSDNKETVNNRQASDNAGDTEHVQPGNSVNDQQSIPQANPASGKTAESPAGYNPSLSGTNAPSTLQQDAPAATSQSKGNPAVAVNKGKKGWLVTGSVNSDGNAAAARPAREDKVANNKSNRSTDQAGPLKGSNRSTVITNTGKAVSVKTSTEPGAVNVHTDDISVKTSTVQAADKTKSNPAPAKASGDALAAQANPVPANAQTNPVPATAPANPVPATAATDTAAVATTRPVDSTAVAATAPAGLTADSTAVATTKKPSAVPRLRWFGNVSAGSGFLATVKDKKNDPTLSADVASNSPVFNSPTIAPGIPSNAAAVLPPSESRAGIGFHVSAGMQLTLTKRSSVSAGIGYSYQSQRIRVGEYRDVALQQGFSQAYNIAARAYTGYPVKSFTDQYHFISMPLRYHLLLTPVSKFRLQWNAGFTPAYMVSADALVYSPAYGGSYVRDNSTFNRFRISAGTGIDVLFRKNGRTSWSLGPEVTMALRRLSGSKYDNQQRAIYTGLSARYFFGR